MVEIPNDNWIRSIKKPEYAVCLDPDSIFFGWKMLEDNECKEWIVSGRLDRCEIIKAMCREDFKNHLKQLTLLLENLSNF